MNLTIRYFGMTTDAAQKSSEAFEVPAGITISELRRTINSKYEQLKNISYKIAVDQELTNDENRQIIEASEIALLPAFAGG